MVESESSGAPRGGSDLAASVLYVHLPGPLRVVREEGRHEYEAEEPVDRYGTGRRPYSKAGEQFRSHEGIINLPRILEQLSQPGYEELGKSHSSTHRPSIGCNSCDPYNAAA